MKFVDACSESLATLKETSYDSDHNEYMTESGLVVVNFDNAKTLYMSRFKYPEDMKSVDALARGADDNLYMIEFKNGRNIDGTDIRLKIKDSVLILCDLCDKRLEDARTEIIFVLVINSSRVQLKAYDKIAIMEANITGIACKFCGLNKSAGFLVKQVFIFDAGELENKLLPKLINMSAGKK